MTAAAMPAAGPTANAIFHLHPLRRCNLACAHCYSDSAPHAAGMLTFEQAAGAIRQAAAWGYTRLAISGGEPLLYPWLADVVALALDCGMQTALITNGLLVPHRGNLDILRQVDTVAVSIDGLGAAHDRIRRRPRAFDGVLRTLGLLADAGIGFHIICGVSGENLDDVDELAALACERGAAALQLHPISAAGRARTTMADAVLGPDDANLLYLAGTLLAAAYAGKMGVHTDLVHRNCVIARPCTIYARTASASDAGARPADLLGVLVLEPDGTVNPVSFGFGPLYGLGNILEQPLGSMWERWLGAGYRRLIRLGRGLLADLAAQSGPSVFNPSDVLRLASHQVGAPLPRRGASREAAMAVR
ncbi:radical SAM protein [Massilia pseudoviolaceinigra]|uniref:radical SAM protein n=1 Tax=Massilia pseudoviolaceinigra TaxID=3057165 RepID=UPI0027966FAD|nr:radical SAM protein [Massilia sp. CCM 9206]MDQ1919291.1 radical SAM protein [Massilia sp. CCM 9206]